MTIKTATIILATAIAFICGCLTPVRFMMPHGPVGMSGTDEHGIKHSVTNTWKCFPTVWMRCAVLEGQFDDTNTNRHWSNWIPITAIWLTVPLDGIVDTIFIPYDLSANQPMKNKEGRK